MQDVQIVFLLSVTIYHHCASTDNEVQFRLLNLLTATK